MDNNIQKTQDPAAAGLLLKPDGSPYRDENACLRRRKSEEAAGNVVQVVQYKDGVALRIIGKSGSDHRPGDEGSVSSASGSTAAPGASSGSSDPLEARRRELAAVDEELRIEEDLARKRDKLATLRRSNQPNNRPVRRSISVRNRLVAAQVPNMKRVYVNDSEDGLRIQDMEACGYNLVEDPNADAGIEVKGDPKIASRLGKAISQVVGADNANRPVRAYLMEMPLDQYEARQRDKQEEIAERERGLFRVPEGLRGMGAHPQITMVPVGQEDEAARPL